MIPKSLEKIRSEIKMRSPDDLDGVHLGFNTGVSAILNAPEFKAVLEVLGEIEYLECFGSYTSNIGLKSREALTAFNEWVKK